MNSQQRGLSITADQLRQTFDESFAVPAAPPAEDWLDFLLIGLSDARYALPLEQLAGLAARRKIVPLPADDPALMGLAGFHGRLVPVYNLAAILGHAPDPQPPAWLALHGTPEPLGLAFDELHGHLRLPRAELFAPDTVEQARGLARQALRLGQEVRFVLDLPAVVQAIRQRLALALGS